MSRRTSLALAAVVLGCASMLATVVEAAAPPPIFGDIAVTNDPGGFLTIGIVADRIEIAAISLPDAGIMRLNTRATPTFNDPILVSIAPRAIVPAVGVGAVWRGVAAAPA